MYKIVLIVATTMRTIMLPVAFFVSVAVNKSVLLQVVKF